MVLLRLSSILLTFGLLSLLGGCGTLEAQDGGENSIGGITGSGVAGTPGGSTSSAPGGGAAGVMSHLGGADGGGLGGATLGSGGGGPVGGSTGVGFGGATSGVGGTTSGVGGTTSGVGGTTSGVGGTTSGVGGTTSGVGGIEGSGGLWRGPTPATDSANFPFPQNRHSAGCSYPSSYTNEEVLAVYEQWKEDLVTADGAQGFRRVRRPAEPGLAVNSTVSEGIAYGMMIAVYMNDQALFDDLWKYSLLHSWTYVPWGGGASVPTILMNWYILADGSLGTDPSGNGAATDADEDMAWALVMADRQWGGSGSLSQSYLDYARQLLDDIFTYEIYESKLIKNGSSWGNWNSLNISYFSPAYYRVFADVTGNATWRGDVIDCVYDTIAGNLTPENGNQENGLVPAFSTSTGGEAVVDPGQAPLRHDYQYDSCRTPFRIGLDACLFDEPRARDYVARTSRFFAGIGAQNIVDGYALSGTPTPEFPDLYGGQSAAFIGPAGVGAMHDPQYQGFVDDVWTMIKTNRLWCGGQYYDESWTMLSMLVLSGNFLDYTAMEPVVGG